MNKITLAAILLAQLSSCSSFDKPYALVDGGSGKIPQNKYYDVLITKVDGVHLLNKKALLKLEPGSHQLRVVSTKEDATPRDQKSYADFNLKTEPCMKYYLSAYHANELSLDMTIEVKKAEKIERCDDLIKDKI